jgi:hypothetical protein
VKGFRAAGRGKTAPCLAVGDVSCKNRKRPEKGSNCKKFEPVSEKLA